MAVAGRVSVLSVVVRNFHKNLIIYFRFGHTKQPTENENVFNSIEMNWPTQQWHCMPLVCVCVGLSIRIAVRTVDRILCYFWIFEFIIVIHHSRMSATYVYVVV